MTKLGFGDAEGMLNLGANHGDDPVDLVVDGVKLATLGHLVHDIPDLAWLVDRSIALCTDIGVVGPDRGLVPMERFIPYAAAMHLRSRRPGAVNGAVHIDTDVRLHA